MARDIGEYQVVIPVEQFTSAPQKIRLKVSSKSLHCTFMHRAYGRESERERKRERERESSKINKLNSMGCIDSLFIYYIYFPNIALPTVGALLSPFTFYDQLNHNKSVWEGIQTVMAHQSMALSWKQWTFFSDAWPNDRYSQLFLRVSTDLGDLLLPYNLHNFLKNAMLCHKAYETLQP